MIIDRQCSTFTSPLKVFSIRRTLACLGFIAANLAHAHLMPEHKGTINVRGQEAYVVMSVSLRQLSGVDDNHDGLINAAEFNAHHEQIKADLRTQGRLSQQINDEINIAPWGEVLLNLPSLGNRDDRNNDPTHRAQGSPYVIFMGVAHLAAPVLFANRPTPLTWQPPHLSPENAPPQQIRLTVEENQVIVAADSVLVSSQQPTATFFAAPSLVLSTYFVWGLVHIAFGWDHLLFLLVLLASHINLRRWFVLLSTFTLAHGFTYAAIALQLLAMPEQAIPWIELGIALSIVFTATLALIRVRPSWQAETWLVLAFGFLHGMGFSAAMQDHTISAATHAYTTWSLIGFNLGIEAGQVLVALAFFLLWHLSHRLLTLNIPHLPTITAKGASIRIQQWPFVAALGIAAFWSISRFMAL